MSVQPFVLRPAQHGAALNMVGTQVTVLASNAATQSYRITLQQIRPSLGIVDVIDYNDPSCVRGEGSRLKVWHPEATQRSL